MLRIIALAVLVAAAHSAPLWGTTGHEVTGLIASELVSKETLSSMNRILAGMSIADASTWADHIKHSASYKWSEPLHFINTPSWACDYEPQRDCADEVCVAGAVSNYTYRLHTQTDTVQVQEALKFLLHFVGDIHQPLHVAFASDRGGNYIHGTFEGDDTELHAIWDYGIINRRVSRDFSNNESSYVKYLVSQILGPWSQNATEWASCPHTQCATQWGTETAAAACQFAYVNQVGEAIQNHFSLGDAYYNFALPEVERQLAKGGVRLAATLDKVLSSSSTAAARDNHAKTTNN